MRTTIVFTAWILLLSGCSLLAGPPQESAASKEAVLQALVAKDMAGLYDDIAAFCLAHIEGDDSQSALLTTAGFSKWRDNYERIWTLNGVETGIRLRARAGRFSPRGCSLDTQYNPSFDVLPLASPQEMQNAWADYLTGQGFVVADEQKETVKLVSKEGEEILDFGFGGGVLRVARRGALHIKLSSYSNGVRSQQVFEVLP